jgi:hypothetical protein
MSPSRLHFLHGITHSAQPPRARTHFLVGLPKLKSRGLDTEVVKMVGSTKWKHETKEGVLNVMIDHTPIPNGSSGKNRVAVQLVFECAATGAFYDALPSYELLCHICPLLHAIDEISDTMSEMPTITVDDAMAMIHWTARGKSRTYPIDIALKRREYPNWITSKSAELCAENAALLDRVARLEIRIEQMDAANKKCISDLSILAALSYHNTAVAPRMIYAPLSYGDRVVTGRSIVRCGIPVLQEMSDVVLGRMVEPLCDFNDTIVPESLFGLEYDKIMRVVDRGFDPNRIASSSGMPLIFKVINDHEAAGPSIRARAELFAKSVSFIKYLLEKNYNPNVEYKGEIVLQILAKHVPVGKRMLQDRAFHKSCIEYVEYCETLTKMIHDVNTVP